MLIGCLIEKAYSVIYLRMEDSSGAVYTPLITSKSRVAPHKPLTIPKLELTQNGELIMARLLDVPLSSVHVLRSCETLLGMMEKRAL